MREGERRSEVRRKVSAVSQRYGHPRVLGIPIPKTLMIWASPLTLNPNPNH